ncbi:unnamed protein product [Heterobilharzia americana]|nr:unnamed protein product [Heterobilharzia americana]
MTSQPRRYPLLGEDDRMMLKLIEHSQFSQNKKYGTLDHAGSPTPIRLIWKTELQNIDFGLLLPELIEGLTDVDQTVVNVAKVAITDILKHGPLDKLIDTLPVLTEAIRKVLTMKNVEAERRVLVVLKHVSLIQPGIGPDMSFYLRNIFQHLNYYFEHHKNYNHQIVYNLNLSDDI